MCLTILQRVLWISHNRIRAMVETKNLPTEQAQEHVTFIREPFALTAFFEHELLLEILIVVRQLDALDLALLDSWLKFLALLLGFHIFLEIP